MRVGNNLSQHVLIMSTFCSALISVLIIYHSGLANTFFSPLFLPYLNRKYKTLLVILCVFWRSLATWKTVLSVHGRYATFVDVEVVVIFCWRMFFRGNASKIYFHVDNEFCLCFCQSFRNCYDSRNCWWGSFYEMNAILLNYRKIKFCLAPLA